MGVGGLMVGLGEGFDSRFLMRGSRFWDRC
jgi:hypothetical protein